MELSSTARKEHIGVTFRTRSIEEMRAIFDEVRKDIWPAVEARKLHLPIDQIYKFAARRSNTRMPTITSAGSW
ncbi:hypothetical protein PMN64_41830 [Bradyrhizobium sp. UFLA01-814]